MSSEPHKVIWQRWIVVLPTGEQFQAGYSLHVTEKDRVAMVADVATRLGTDLTNEREEPLGDPVVISVSADEYEKIQAHTHGIRVK
jgi:hypothetical protein